MFLNIQDLHLQVEDEEIGHILQVSRNDWLEPAQLARIYDYHDGNPFPISDQKPGPEPRVSGLFFFPDQRYSDLYIWNDVNQPRRANCVPQRMVGPITVTVATADVPGGTFVRHTHHRRINAANAAEGVDEPDAANAAEGDDEANAAEGDDEANAAEGDDEANAVEGHNQANAVEGHNQANAPALVHYRLILDPQEDDDEDLGEDEENEDEMDLEEYESTTDESEDHLDSDPDYKPSSGDEDDSTSEPSWGMDCSKVVRVKELHISSPILAAKSPFFYKLFSNGMRESEQRHVTFRINASVKISDIVACAAEQILTDEQPDMDGCPDGDNLDDESEAMVEEEALSGGEDTSEPSWGMDCSKVVRDNELHISSHILAAKSPFFYKLFSDGMRESEQRHVTLRISASEEAALMELLNFMYSNVVSVTTAPALLDVLMAADKFEVASCMRYCSRLLRNMPMTPDSALLYLELPFSVLMAKSVQPLTDAAKQFLAARYKDISKFHEEVMSLPLAGIEAILSSDELQIASEDAVYDFILKWARAQYTSLEEPREILGSRLALSIRFPFMTCRKLKKVLTCSDFEHVVLEALFYKAEAPHRQRSLAAGESGSLNHRLIERAYKFRPVKVVEFELPRPQCVVYLDLKREECAGLFPAGRVYSQAFHLGGQGFFLSAHCNLDQQGSFHCFGLFLGMQEKGSVSFGVDYEFLARSRPSEEFISKYRGNYTFTGGKAVGYRNLFGMTWTSFIGEDCFYFINGILHLRAELTIKRSPDPQ